jgi:hypothetical protein
MPRSPARALRVGAAAVVLAVPALAAPALPAQAAGAPRQISYRQWDTTAQLRSGAFSGTGVASGTLRLTRPSARVRVGGRDYVRGTWTSPWVRPGFRLTELVPSWAATTPVGTLVQVDVRGLGPHGTRSSWDTLARWAGPDRSFRRTSLGSQRDDLAHVATDTWETYAGLPAWQLRVSLLRRVGSRATPVVGTVGAMASRLPLVDRVARSQPGVARGTVLGVPRYSQMVHAGEYPRYGGGGEAWCSPTATTMVLAYYRRLPPARDYAWVRRSYPDRVVDHAARMTFDHGYDGTGNWSFNTAYAAGRTGHAFVTRFASLRGVERLIAAGIPVVTSITFGAGQLRGAPIRATNGHLVVVVGFTRAGDVVVNDPAARTRAGVRRTYARGQFENAWLKRYPSGGTMRGSGGLAYVVRDGAHPLPARSGTRSW